jgi:integrase
MQLYADNCYLCVTNVLQMNRAEASIYIDSKRPRQDGRCAIKLRVTFNRTRKYYHTGILLSEYDFKQVFSGRKKTDEQKTIAANLFEILNKANDAINGLTHFTFEGFANAFTEDREVRDSVYFAFETTIKQLKEETRLGTASSYECAMRSLAEFRKELTFADLTADFLKKYEEWMVGNGKSLTTVGFYLRNLRAIYNQNKASKDNPIFGSGRNQYSIPSGRNIKKALTHEEIKRLFKHKELGAGNKEKAKDYWFFLFLCNGMNVKDFCRLKWKNIDGNILRYTRAKTERNKRDNRQINVALKPQTLNIIEKWGNPDRSPDNFIFPHLNPSMDEETQRKKYQELTKQINKHIKNIAIEAGISKKVTTYSGRHSFATILKREGRTEELISELLGHGSVAITRNYLDSFEDDHIQRTTDVLVDGLDD